MDGNKGYEGLTKTGEGYGPYKFSKPLYADARKASPKKASASKPPAPASPEITITVNPNSTLKANQFVNLLIKTAGLPVELKKKIRYKNNEIFLPDYSRLPQENGKEWLFDLGKAGNDWEITTGTVIKQINRDPAIKDYLVFNESKYRDEERGWDTSKGQDPDNSLIKPTTDLKDTEKWGYLTGLTVPTQEMLDKNPSLIGTLPPPQVARLRSGKGLIIIAINYSVRKGDQFLGRKESFIPVPLGLVVMSFFHELAAHAGFLSHGLPPEHLDPPDPSNPPDRNAAQVEQIYTPAIAKGFPSFEVAVKDLTEKTRQAIK